MNNDSAIVVSNIKRYYGEIKAVDDVSFIVNRGEIFSLLGPNGAGKTTIISMLSCLLEPDDGDAQIMGNSVTSSPQKVKASIGVVPQDIALYEDLSARENLNFWGRMYGLKGSLLKERVDSVLGMIGLQDRQKGRIGKFSGGMKRRVNIGVALLHHPDVIIMDEPTVGIDPQSRRHILDGVKTLNQDGMTVLYTTHYMEEAQELSNHIAIMDHGHLIGQGTHDDLVHLVGEQDRVNLRLSEGAESLLEEWRQLEDVSQITSEDGNITLLTADSNAVLPQLFETAGSADVRITSVEIQEPNLETVFLHLTGRALRD